MKCAQGSKLCIPFFVRAASYEEPFPSPLSFLRTHLAPTRARQGYPEKSKTKTEWHCSVKARLQKAKALVPIKSLPWGCNNAGVDRKSETIVKVRRRMHNWTNTNGGLTR